jgi:transposase
VKTDRRDAEKLARCYRAGELTSVWVPDANHEALRDLVRAREAAKQDQLRHHLGKFLLRHGKRPTDVGKAWSQKYLNWIRIHVHFEQPALEATLKHYREEVDHIAERITKPEQAIDEAVQRRLPKFAQ